MTVKMQLNWWNVGLHLDRRGLNLLKYLITWTLKDGHTQCKGPFLLCTLTLNIYCASIKKLLKISEPMITATQMVWMYFCWMRSQLHPFLVVMTAIYFFYRSDKTKKHDWKEVLQNLCILLWNENKRVHTLKLSFLSSIRLFVEKQGPLSSTAFR